MKASRGWLRPAALLSLCMGIYLVSMLPQDRILVEYGQAFREVRHPPGTRFVAAYYAFGALDKMRLMYAQDFPQGCDYRVGEIREYDSTKADIEAFYRAQAALIRGERLAPGVLFLPIDEAGNVDPFGLPEPELSQWGPAAVDLLENFRRNHSSLHLEPSASYYYVGIGGFSLSQYDIRCRF